MKKSKKKRLARAEAAKPDNFKYVKRQLPLSEYQTPTLYFENRLDI